mgnify:CR=1 FL=1
MAKDICKTIQNASAKSTASIGLEIEPHRCRLLLLDTKEYLFPTINILSEGKNEKSIPIDSKELINNQVYVTSKYISLIVYQNVFTN